MPTIQRFTAAAILWGLGVSLALAQQGGTISLDKGKFELAAPAGWVKKTPAIAMIEVEYAIPAAKGDTTDGRLTMMSATGTVEQNIERWIGQFVQPDTKDRMKTRDLTVSGLSVKVVDLSGTYKDSAGGPMGPTVERPKYRMLGAIIDTKTSGNYFVKFYGPENTIAEQEAAFTKMLESLKKK